MCFVLDNSVAMRWLLCDGNAERLACAEKVLAELGQTEQPAFAWQ